MNRNEFIVKGVKRGIPPAELARDLGITREYVRVIFRKETGANPSSLAHSKLKPMAARKNVFCNNCGKEMGRNKRLRFCSGECRGLYYKYSPGVKSCLICKRKFLLIRNNFTPGQLKKRKYKDRYFCSPKCSSNFTGYKKQLKKFKDGR